MKTYKKVLIIGIIIIILLFISLFCLAVYTPLKALPTKEMNKIQEMSLNISDDKIFLKTMYDYIIKKFKSERNCWGKDLLRPFILNPKKLLELEGQCLPCNQYNKLLQKYLIESKRFNKKQIKTKITFDLKSFSIHIYSQIIIEKEIIDVDVWGGDLNITFGQTIQDVDIYKTK